jgi:hypothetical protein
MDGFFVHLLSLEKNKSILFHNAPLFGRRFLQSRRTLSPWVVDSAHPGVKSHVRTRGAEPEMLRKSIRRPSFMTGTPVVGNLALQIIIRPAIPMPAEHSGTKASVCLQSDIYTKPCTLMVPALVRHNECLRAGCLRA